MQKYFLVIDTETSGLPKNWNKPYFDEKNWPSIVQIAWVIYDEQFNEIKRDNHYIKNNDYTISKAAIKIHNITNSFLQLYGEDKKTVLLKLINDISQYNPLMVGHFIEFDYHILNAEFYRIGKPNVLENQSFFCTMMASIPYVKNPAVAELKLDQFYELLFNEIPSDLHNALADALNTSRIFFHLLNTSDHKAIELSYYIPKKENLNTKRIGIKNLLMQLFPILSVLWKVN